MKFLADVKNYIMIESLGWDYFEEEVLAELFSLKEFFEEEDLYYTLEEVDVVSSGRKFEPFDMKTKGDKKKKISIEEPPELELKPLVNHLKYTYYGRMTLCSSSSLHN